MDTLTIERDGVKIPFETLEEHGITVVTLAPRAWLIMTSEAIQTYPREKLAALERAARQLVGAGEYPAYYHPSKVRALKEMRAMGINVSGGEEYGLAYRSDIPSLEQVQSELATVSDSLSDDIIAARAQE